MTLEELRTWSNTFAIAGHPDVSAVLRLRARSTLRSAGEAMREGNAEQAEQWIDALQDFRELAERGRATIESTPPGGDLPRGTAQAVEAEMTPIVARMPPFNAQEAAEAQRLANRIYSRANLPVPRVPSESTGRVPSGLLLVAAGAAAFMLFRSRR